MRLIFAGTPEFALPALRALVGSPHEIVAVFTQPDRPAGRGRTLRSSPVKRFAEQHGLPVYQPASLDTRDPEQAIAALHAEVMVVAAYGLLLPRAILNQPRFGCINIHASLLPRWRGAAPVQRAILAGDDQSGVTMMQMTPGLDTGDILMRWPTPITAEDTAQTLHDRLAELGAGALLVTLEKIETDTLSPLAQNDREATYAAKLEKYEAEIDWRDNAAASSRQSISASYFSSLAAYVASRSFCARGESVSVSIFSRVTSSAPAPSSASRSCRVWAVSSAVMGVGHRMRISPVSRPGAICIMVTPDWSSPARIARCTGAAPRQRGSSEA